MSQNVIFGSDAAVTFPTGAGGLFNAFTCTVAQGLASAIGFGKTWTRTRGTGLGWSGSIAGFLTEGTTNDRPGITTVMTRTGSVLTLTPYTGCTLTGTAIFSATSIGAEFSSADTLGYSFTGDDVLTETWVTA